MEALLLVGVVVLILLAFIIESTVHQLKGTLEEQMAELKEVVTAVVDGIHAHATTQQAALDRLQEDVTAMRAQIDAGSTSQADMQAAADRLQAGLTVLSQSTATLAALDVDPNNPVVPPPPPPPDDTGGGTTPPAPDAPPPAPAPGPGGEVPVPPTA